MNSDPAWPADYNSVVLEWVADAPNCGDRPGAQGGDAGGDELAMSPSSVAQAVTPNASVSTAVMASAADSDTGTRMGASSPSGAGFIHISLATLA